MEHESSQHRLELHPELQSDGAAPCADGAHPRESWNAHSTPTGQEPWEEWVTCPK